MSSLAQDAGRLTDFISAYPHIAVLTGAGLSCDSGIPTYRDTDGVWQHSEPVKHQEFVGDHRQRQRYWVRSYAGWPRVHTARPNAAQLALAVLERRGTVVSVITQNVDRLHQRAGSERVLDLHGRLDRVRCLDCQRLFSREQIQTRLRRKNPWLASASGGAMKPDGDADTPGETAAKLDPPACLGCGGPLMPDVVFYGGSVPVERVQAGMAAIEQADALLVIGTSLQVFSGFRFCRAAHKLGKPIALINPGSSRADDMASLSLRSPCAPLLELAVLQTAAAVP